MTTETLTRVTIGTAILQDLVNRAVKGSTMVEMIPLSNLMKIEIKDNVLYVKTTDMVNFVTVRAGVQQPDFSVVVQSSLFSKLVGKLSTATTSLIIEGNKLIIEANGKYNVSIVTDVDGSEVQFPEITSSGTSTYKLTSDQVKSILSVNKGCKAEAKEIPTLFNYYADDTQVITSNRIKACINPISVFDEPVCVTPNFMELIPAVLDENGVIISKDENTLMASSTIGNVVGKRVCKEDVDEYPATPIRQLFADSMDLSCSINRTLLEQAVDRICLFVDEFQSNKLTMTFSKNQVELYSDTSDSNEIVTYIESVETLTKDITIDVDALFFKNELSVCDREDIILRVNDSVIQIICGSIQLVLSVLGTAE